MPTADVPAYEEAAALIREAGSLVAVGHVNPDGDALGSAVALATAARDAGISAWAAFGEPLALSDDFRFLSLETIATPGEIPDAIDVLVACDTANLDRLGSAAELVARASNVVVVDHHASNDGFGDVFVIDPSAAATAQLVYRLTVDHLGWSLSAEAATALYTGLVTDTGRFQYSATTPEVHEIAAALLEAGANPDTVARHLYGEAPFGYLLVAGAVLSRAVLNREVGLVWSVLRSDDLEQGGIGLEETDGLIDLVRLAAEAEVACLLKEYEPQTFKGSLRSRGAVDVNAVAGRFGGGGHHNAAGFNATGDPRDIAERLAGYLR